MFDLCGRKVPLYKLYQFVDKFLYYTSSDITFNVILNPIMFDFTTVLFNYLILRGQKLIYIRFLSSSNMLTFL